MENNLNNLPPFYIGQKVVYIGTKDKLKKGIHTILAIYKGNCKCIDFEVEIELKNDIIIDDATHVKCTDCGEINISSKYRTFTFCSSSFRPLQESVFPSLKLSKVIEKESQLISMN